MLENKKTTKKKEKKKEKKEKEKPDWEDGDKICVSPRSP